MSGNSQLLEEIDVVESNVVVVEHFAVVLQLHQFRLFLRVVPSSCNSEVK